MIVPENIFSSTKRIGKYEEIIINILANHFKSKGYDVFPHSSLNIAWGSTLSDIDLLLVKDNLLTYIEVKSSRDNISRARKQIDRVIDYVDYAYVATDKNVKKWEMGSAGLILIRNEKVILAKRGKKFHSKPRFYSVVTLRKKCLSRFFGMDKRCITMAKTYELAQRVYKKDKCSREILKEIVTCGELCLTCCPISQREVPTLGGL
jgi:hypothetical protein